VNELADCYSQNMTFRLLSSFAAVDNCVFLYRECETVSPNVPVSSYSRHSLNVDICHTHHNSHFPDEPGLAGCQHYKKGFKVSFSGHDALPLTQHAFVKALKD